MNQRKKSYKKTLVRNTEEPTRKVTLCNELEGLGNVDSNKKLCHKSISQSQVSRANLSEPIIQSTLGLTKQIASVENIKPRKIKSLSDVDKKALGIDEKLTRKVNFRYDQPIYKDLIPLSVKPQPSLGTVSRNPMPLKDREPNLSDFCRYKVLPEYKFQVPTATTETNVCREYHGTRLYKIMQNWESNL